MFTINEDYISPAYEDFRNSVKSGKSFAVTGLTSVLRLFLTYKTKAYSNKKDYKKKVWNYKKISSIVAVCACAIMVFKIPGVQASLQNTINKFASWISGNSRDDYYEEIDSSVENNGFKLQIIKEYR